MDLNSKDGGPAFAKPIGNSGEPDFHDREVSSEQSGMSLEDYFAAAALTGILAGNNRCSNDVACAFAWECAKKMISIKQKADSNG